MSNKKISDENNGHTLDVRIEKNNLFDEFFPKREMKWREVSADHVSDIINSQELWEWERTYDTRQVPILINAPTGCGKNYFVVNVLRLYALETHRRILYISNRVALDDQQKSDLAKATKANYDKNPTYFAECDYEGTFDNVTVITYNRLLHKFSTLPADDPWFLRYDYIVIDECHFFYSDAYFNAYTDVILQNITTRFMFGKRIYMSATFDDIVFPIFSYEWINARKLTDDPDYFHSQFSNYFFENPFAYRFKRDFSHYKVYFFDELDDLVERIGGSASQNNKWVLFIDNKIEGQYIYDMIVKEIYRVLLEGFQSTLGNDFEIIIDALNEQLDLMGMARSMVAYLDSNTRNEPDYESKAIWGHLLETGELPRPILITTSVLDNGFSIKDPAVKSVVICTDDKTEFQQEKQNYKAACVLVTKR